MLDTNIYIDMVVSRNGSHKAESYYQLKKLLDYGEIKLIVPRIVITEVFRHIDNEIDKVGYSINEMKKRANDLYWINNSEELEKFNKILKPAKSSMNLLVDEFNGNSKEYKKKYRELFNKLYENANCIVLEENKNIVFKAMQRSIYKKGPFHYGGKDSDKDSMADAIIIETLINIDDLIDGIVEDSIYFISRNPVDFSAKEDNNLLHNDILSDIEARGMTNRIKYSTLFTKTLLQDFKDEIESVGLTEELEAEEEYERRLEIQESYDLQEDYEREAVGLSSLSTDYEELVSQLDDVVNLMQLIQEIKEEIVGKCDDYYDKYYSCEELVTNNSLENLQDIINNNSLIKIVIDECENENDIKDGIRELIEWRIGDEFYADFGEEFKGDDFFSLNCNLLTFSDGLKNEYRLESIGYINPSNDDEDTISINLYRSDKLIASGSINIYYGFIEYDEDGNVGNGSGEDITVNIDNVISKLIDIKENMVKDLHWRIDKLQNLIQVLS